ncbi:MAG: type II secretion system protein [Pseudomonadota bacterium]
MTAEYGNPVIRAKNPGGGFGFTIVELVVVITILGLMAAVLVPRFLGSDAFASRGFYDSAKSVVRFAQKIAIAERANATLPKTLIFVVVGATNIRVCRDAACATQIADPISGGPLAATAPSGVTLTVVPAGDFTFDGLGRPSAAKTITLNSTIAGDPARQIVVEAETGYVHP